VKTTRERLIARRSAKFFSRRITTPAVQAPFGDFFCHSLGQMVTFENACFSSPEGRSFNCVVPWYLDRPENGLPPIAPAAARMKDLP
jgi:hypothetical protein